MKFWDSSAIVPLVCREATSDRCRQWLTDDPIMLVWALSAVEVVSALARRLRDGGLEAELFRGAKQKLVVLEEAWNEVVRHETVAARARRLLETHPLRAADSLQLAAALVAVEERTRGVEFVTFDGRLAEAASKEGFEVLAS